VTVPTRISVSVFFDSKTNLTYYHATFIGLISVLPGRLALVLLLRFRLLIGLLLLLLGPLVPPDSPGFLHDPGSLDFFTLLRVLASMAGRLTWVHLHLEFDRHLQVRVWF
jgi:hypothetical protein